MAKLKGAKVIATVSSPEKGKPATQVGADQIINYRDEDVVERVREITSGAGVDHVVEVNFGASAMQLPGLIKNGGFVAAYCSNAFEGKFPMVGAVIQQVRLGFFIVFMLPRDVLDKAIAELGGMLEADQISAPIHARFPLDQIAQAHDAVDEKPPPEML
ncbi:zinc-binding dehydrogenase [uncultured Ruegeria sp.]|uniref:zinc-binding dehydrogenase n=1 Tax=uncultured Ruegeria sp. TaxID=259304 RepID=UPI0026045067|nr:zinc-binding dehydrogenase [uncultured Ruegeria sp.]